MAAEGYLAISGQVGELSVIGLLMHDIVNIWLILLK